MKKLTFFCLGIALLASCKNTPKQEIIPSEEIEIVDNEITEDEEYEIVASPKQLTDDDLNLVGYPSNKFKNPLKVSFTDKDTFEKHKRSANDFLIQDTTSIIKKKWNHSFAVSRYYSVFGRL